MVHLLLRNQCCAQTQHSPSPWTSALVINTVQAPENCFSTLLVLGPQNQDNSIQMLRRVSCATSENGDSPCFKMWGESEQWRLLSQRRHKVINWKKSSLQIAWMNAIVLHNWVYFSEAPSHHFPLHLFVSQVMVPEILISECSFGATHSSWSTFCNINFYNPQMYRLRCRHRKRKVIPRL
jgi:hypothetical protein